MVDFSRFNASGDDRRDELIRAIEHAVEHLTQGELEASYYDMLTKRLIADQVFSLFGVLQQSHSCGALWHITN